MRTASGVTHGLFFVPPNKFFTFDYPGSTFTSLNGINEQGFYLWSLRRCFRHCPRIHSSRQRHTADKSGGAGNEGAERCNTGALSLSIGGPCVVGRFATTPGLDAWPTPGVAPTLYVRWNGR